MLFVLIGAHTFQAHLSSTDSFLCSLSTETSVVLFLVCILKPLPSCGLGKTITVTLPATSYLNSYYIGFCGLPLVSFLSCSIAISDSSLCYSVLQFELKTLMLVIMPFLSFYVPKI